LTKKFNCFIQTISATQMNVKIVNCTPYSIDVFHQHLPNNAYGAGQVISLKELNIAGINGAVTDLTWEVTPLPYVPGACGYFQLTALRSAAWVPVGADLVVILMDDTVPDLLPSFHVKSV
jgi:hypothetical protein